MTPGEFFAGGDLQTVKSVYVRLLGCAAVPGAMTIAADGARPWTAAFSEAVASKKSRGKRKS